MLGTARSVVAPQNVGVSVLMNYVKGFQREACGTTLAGGVSSITTGSASGGCCCSLGLRHRDKVQETHFKISCERSLPREHAILSCDRVSCLRSLPREGGLPANLIRTLRSYVIWGGRYRPTHSQILKFCFMLAGVVPNC